MSDEQKVPLLEDDITLKRLIKDWNDFDEDRLNKKTALDSPFKLSLMWKVVPLYLIFILIALTGAKVYETHGSTTSPPFRISLQVALTLWVVYLSIMFVIPSTQVPGKIVWSILFVLFMSSVYFEYYEEEIPSENITRIRILAGWFTIGLLIGLTLWSFILPIRKIQQGLETYKKSLEGVTTGGPQ